MTFYTKRRRMPQVIIVSLIDIFAILLIFVIVTTTFKKDQPAVTIQLPDSRTAVASDKVEDNVVLTISAEQELFLDEKKMSLDELRTAIKQLVRENVKRTLALNADTKAEYGTVIGVLDVLREGGVKGNLAAFMQTKK